MKIGILGTGEVGRTLGTKLVSLGHSVKLGSRTSTHEDAVTWAKAAGPGASYGTFAEAAEHGELLFNCTHGAASISALRLAKATNLSGKVLIDVANALDFSQGMPPTLLIPSTDSLAEQIQKEFPEARVVKTLNTVAAPIMVDPGKFHHGEHSIFLCGNDPAAKKTVHDLLRDGFGWKEIIDLGDLSMARGTEAYLLLWTRLFLSLQSPMFNVRIVR